MTQEEKSSYHIFRCNEPEMKVYRKELYDQIKEWLIEQETHQILIDMLMAVIWRKKIEIPQEYTTYWSATKNKLKKTYIFTGYARFLATGYVATTT